MELRAAFRLLAMDPYHEYEDWEGEHALKGRWTALKDKHVIKTDTQYELVVGREWKDYYVFITTPSTTDDPILHGYVRFEKVLTIRVGWQGLVFRPHSYMKPDYRGRGYISSIYKWFINSGHCLVASNSHTPSASKLWKSLISKYPHFFVKDVRGTDPTRKLDYVITDADDGTDNTIAVVGLAGPLSKAKKALQ